MKWYEEILSKMTFEGEDAETKKAEIESLLKSTVGKHFVSSEDYGKRKAELEELQTKYETDIAERDKQLEDLAKNAGDKDKLLQTIEDMKSKNEISAQEHSAAMEELKKQGVKDRKVYALREKFIKDGLDEKYLPMVMGQIDLDKITSADDGSFIGINDVTDPFKEEYAAMYNTTGVIGTPAPTPAPENPPKPGEKNLEQLRKNAESGDANARLAYITAKTEALAQEQGK